jgi:hypothetical protein
MALKRGYEEGKLVAIEPRRGFEKHDCVGFRYSGTKCV